MSSERDQILSSIRSAIAPLPEKTPYPEWDDSITVSNKIKLDEPLKDQFLKNLAITSAKSCQSVEEVISLLQAEKVTRGYIDPALASLLPETEGLAIETELNREDVDRYQFGITKAAAVIAETGTIVLKDSLTSDRLGALAPWIHIAVVEEADILPCVKDAVAIFGDDPSIIFATGPSKTADVEGILIEGVHGPGIQVAWVVST